MIRYKPEELWNRCLDNLTGTEEPTRCGKPMTEWADWSWRCEDGHFNSQSQLRREFLGRLVREVWVVWAHDQDNPKPHHLLPWDQITESDREVDRRIGETLLGIRDWRIGQRITLPK
jgi:hypothetical protein